MRRRAAARTVPVLGLDRDVNAREVDWQRAAVRPALLEPSRCGCLVPLVVRRFAGRFRLLDLLERQSELVWIELLGFAAELHPLKLAQQMHEAVVLGETASRSAIAASRSVSAATRRACNASMSVGD